MNIQPYLPSALFKKRLIVISAIVIVLILVPKIWVFVASKIKVHRITDSEAAVIAATDTDGDSVYDWQEKLWGTDINNIATFGVPDATYIKNKQTELTTNDTATDNKTDILSKQLFATVNAIKASTTLNPSDSYREIAENVAQFVTDNPNPDVVVITSKDITIIPNNPTNKKLYAKSIGNLSGTYFGNNTKIGTETSILYYALINEDPAHLPDLDPIISDYETLAKKLTAIKVPELAVADHVQLVNALYAISSALTETKSLFSDSVIGIRGVVGYNKTATELDTIIDRLQTYASN